MKRKLWLLGRPSAVTRRILTETMNSRNTRRPSILAKAGSLFTHSRRLALPRWLRAKASPVISPPQFLFVHVNRRCNLRCQHCAFWMFDDSDRAGYLPWERKREIIGEFAELTPGGAVVICGGESMLDLEDYFAIATACRGMGLRCLSVINGTRVRTGAMAHRMICEGPTEVSVSLNSYLEEEHDRTRGVKGSFRLAVGALRLLLKARENRPPSGARIYAMALIHEKNYRHLDAFYDFVLNDIRADKLKLNFVQPSFGGSGADRFFAAHHILNPGELEAILRACDRKYRLRLNPAWLKQVTMYFQSINRNRNASQGWGASAGTSEHICNTYERNIMVDLYGNARLCFSTKFPKHPLLRHGDLRRFWYEHSDSIRSRMKHCNRYCGISHSVRREPSTLRSDPNKGASGVVCDGNQDRAVPAVHSEIANHPTREQLHFS